MTATQSIEVQLSGSDGRILRVANVLVEIQFFTAGNYRYAFLLGRTDKDGHLSATYADIERLRRRDAEQNVMDYNTPLENCDSSVRVSIPSDRELHEWSDNAVRFYSKRPDWASTWPSNGRVKPCEETLVLEAGRTSIHLRAE